MRYTQLDQSLWWDEGIGVKHAASALELSALLAISLVTDRDLQNFYHKAYCYYLSELYIDNCVSLYELRVGLPTIIPLATQVKSHARLTSL